MNRLKLMSMVLGTCLLLGSAANAATADLGTINFKKVISAYSYAKNISKEIDDEVLRLSQYLLDKDKELKAIESPIARKNFEERVTREYKVKEDALLVKRNKVDLDVTNRIMNATKVIAQQKSLDTVLDYRVVVVGGKDITDDVINYLNAQPQNKSAAPAQVKPAPVKAAPVQQKATPVQTKQKVKPVVEQPKDTKTKTEAKSGNKFDMKLFSKKDKDKEPTAKEVKSVSNTTKK